MKKIKIFLGSVCLIVSFTAAVITKANAKFTSPEYYISSTLTCELLPIETGCLVTGTVQCRVSVTAMEINRPVYDFKNISGECQVPLYELPMPE